MNLNFAICDDNLDDLNHLQNDLSICSFQLDHDFNISSFSKEDELISSFCNNATYDAVFIDIELDGANGIDIAKQIKERFDKHILIIFVSSYPQYMHDSFSVHPFYFLQKPYTINDLKKLLCDVISHIQDTHKLLTLIASDTTQYSVKLSEIYYIETLDSKKSRITFHLNDKSIEVKGTISYWKNLLENYAFAFCNRTTLINMHYIHFIEGKYVYLINNEKLLISNRCKKKLLNNFLNNIVSLQ